MANRTTRSTRLGGALLLLAGVIAAATACELPPPLASFTVTSTGDGTDADPGDGVCEATPGAADCTLRAAVEEADALAASGTAAGAHVAIPAGAYFVAAPSLVVDAHVVLERTGPGTVDLRAAAIHVAAGAQLELTGIQLVDDRGASAPMVVDGVLVVRRSSIYRLELDVIEVGPTGVAAFENAYLSSAIGAVLRNHGLVAMRHVTVGATFASFSPVGQFAIETMDTGVTTLASTALLSTPGFRWPAGRGIACGGTPPVSLGANTAWDSSCALTGPGDVTNANPYEATPTTDPGPTSILVDAVPVGTNGCGTEVVVDWLERPRPQDGDGDGTAACDIGALERPAAP